LLLASRLTGCRGEVEKGEAPELKPHEGRELVQNRFERLDHDQLSQLLADGEAGVANLANEIGLAGQEPDNLVFTKAKFAQAVLKFRGSAKLFDTHGYARFDTGDGANVAAGVFDARFNYLQPIHNQLPRTSPLRRILTTHFLAKCGHKLPGRME
jgi:hypothetical protein